MTYQLVEPGLVKRLTDNAFIPFAEGNTDYQAYLKYVEEGGEVLPADEPAES
jgi:hypothetical protein